LFSFSTLHLFYHVSKDDFLDHLHALSSRVIGSPNNDEVVVLPFDEAEDVLTRSHFPQSILDSSDFELITHPAVDMMVSPSQSQEKEDGNESQNKKKIKVPNFWNPEDFEGDIRDSLGNYGERLITPVEAKRIGSYTTLSKNNISEHEVEDQNKYTELLQTIFVTIASYRDYRCPHTLEQIFKQAKYPERIRVAIVDQLDPKKDEYCSKPKRSCDKYPDDILCKYSYLIDHYELDASLAVGPVFARHIGYRMYRGEYFAVQCDAHMEFINNWDVEVIKQWNSARNEMAVLSTYVSDVDDHYNKETGLGKTATRPKMCNTDFDEDYYDNRLSMLMHGQQPEGFPDVKGEPTLHPFWAAGFSFSRGHFIVQVPYDRYLPMVFQGEEINLGLRGWTYGYDYYTPESSILYHYYNAGPKGENRKVESFYEHSDAYQGLEKAAMARLLGVIQLLPDTKQEGKEDNSEEESQEEAIKWNHVEEKKYGIGKVRTVEKFLKTFGINIYTREVEHHLCQFVGKPMNSMFIPHLRKNGMGIDYDTIDFEFKNPVKHGKQWDSENAEDVDEEEEEEEVEEEKGE